MMKKVYISPGISVIEAETVMPLAAGSNTPPSADNIWNITDEKGQPTVPGMGGDSEDDPNDFIFQSKEDGGSLWD